ncbi:MAG: hypothetical protein HQ567_09575 [Candidatus Nealsonbacteria bacterium]|nr:hypothetical protein [Candidatus Nealsonbacteria bacterium]
MLKWKYRFLLGLFLLGGVLTADARADRNGSAEKSGPKYALRYQFRGGQMFRWDVTHQTSTRTSIAETTKNVDATSKSVKLWRVLNVNDDGSATFEHSVESIDMRQKLSGHKEVRYNSLTDDEVPVGFKDVARAVGVPLSVVTLDSSGKIIKREIKQSAPSVKHAARVTIPLPEKPVPIGHTWSFPHEVNVPLRSGGIKRVKTLQSFELLSVKTGVATIRVATQILSPIRDPAILSQLVQLKSRGEVKFDVDAGCIIGQQMDIDEHVVGWHTDASSLRYTSRFTEKLLPAKTKIAQRPTTPRR